MSNFSPPLDELRIFMSTQFNAATVEGILTGIYSLILWQAIWKLNRKGNKQFYSFILIILWILIIISVAYDWVNNRGAFVLNNDSPLGIVIALRDDAPILARITGILNILVSDAILIWRCNILWANRCILAALVTLLMTTTGLLICTSFGGPIGLHITILTSSLALLSSLITTASTTFLISLKIILVTRRSRMHYSYAKIVEILLQSAALESTVFLGITILELNSYLHPYDMSTTRGRIFYQMLIYFDCLQAPTAGIAPTLIAFRVAEESPQTQHGATSKINPLSRLTFRRTAQNDNDNSEALHKIDARTQPESAFVTDGGDHQEPAQKPGTSTHCGRISTLTPP